MTAQRSRPRLVEPAAEVPIDIHALNRASIEARDWDAAAIWADRQKPVVLAEVSKVVRR